MTEQNGGSTLRPRVRLMSLIGSEPLATVRLRVAPGGTKSEKSSLQIGPIAPIE